MLTGTSPRPTMRGVLPVLRAAWWISTFPATQVTPRRLGSGLVAAMRSAIMSSIPVSTSRISGRGRASAGVSGWASGSASASIGRLWYAPAAGLAHLRAQWATKRLADVTRGDQQRVEVDAMRHPVAIEEVHEVLRCEVARGARSVGAAASAPGRGIEASDAELQGGGDVGQRGSARVVEVHRQQIGGDSGADERANHSPHVAGRTHADGVADADLVDAELDQLTRHAHDRRLTHLALVRAAECGADVAARPPAALARRCDDGSERVDRLRARH